MVLTTDDKQFPPRNWRPGAASKPRKPGWENRLVTELQRQMDAEFAWGKFDCLTQQADVFKAMTGAQLFPVKSRKYSTEADAMKLMRSFGFKDVEQVLKATFKPVAPAKARRGDCGILVRQIDGKKVISALTIFGGFAIGHDAIGPVRVPVLRLKSAYRMG